MFICLCRAVSDRSIKSAIEQGCRSIKDIRSATGAASQCCKCVGEIQAILAEHDENSVCSQDSVVVIVPDASVLCG
ncbi:(2Fe-2S)-binding protein [Pseudomonas luteola]